MAQHWSLHRLTVFTQVNNDFPKAFFWTYCSLNWLRGLGMWLGSQATSLPGPKIQIHGSARVSHQSLWFMDTCTVFAWTINPTMIETAFYKMACCILKARISPQSLSKLSNCVPWRSSSYDILLRAKLHSTHTYWNLVPGKRTQKLYHVCNISMLVR